jgi:WhiB family redox-sensing transcriptional regulator
MNQRYQRHLPAADGRDGGDWRSRGACVTADPEIFYPPPNNSRGRAEVIEEALSWCRRCPVRADCLEWALTTPDAHGVIAGTTPTERRTIRRQRGMAEPRAVTLDLPWSQSSRNQWASEELATLVEMRRRGEPLARIAGELGRTTKAVSAMVRELSEVS